MPPHHHHHHHAWFRPTRTLSRKIEAVEGLIGEVRDVRMLSESAFDDGPDHRRAANSILCGLLHEILEEAARSRSVPLRGYAGEYAAIDYDVPPHHHRRYSGTAALPTRLLSTISEDRRDLDCLIDSLASGPHHDVAANVILLNMLETLYDTVSGGNGAPRVNEQ